MTPASAASQTRKAPPPAPAVTPAPAVITHAGPEHIAGICAIVNACALEGTTLPITADEVALSMGQFVVAEREGQILSCGALIVFSPAIAEIRSIAVSPAARGTGLGAAVVRRLIEEADSLELDQLVLLTKIPDFFGRLGFISASPEDLPEEYLTIQIHARGRTLNGRTAMRLHLM